MTATKEETALEGAEAPVEELAAPNPDTGTPGNVEDVEDDSTTFPREYVQKLRKEAADNRAKAKDRDDLARRLHTALAAATGRLADPTDLPFDEAHLTDADAMGAAIEALLNAKPHLASRKPSGNVGQGAAPDKATVSLAGLLRAGAR